MYENMQRLEAARAGRRDFSVRTGRERRANNDFLMQHFLFNEHSIPK
eukprot:COSAG02_NODE_17508_length_998_cov_5.788654_3_plen_46_part_01